MCEVTGKAVYIAPLKALVRERIKHWRDGEGGLRKQLGIRVEALTGDSGGLLSVRQADLVICTPEKWDSVSRAWRPAKSEADKTPQTRWVESVELVIFDEIHLLGKCDVTDDVTNDAIF